MPAVPDNLTPPSEAQMSIMRKGAAILENDGLARVRASVWGFAMTKLSLAHISGGPHPLPRAAKLARIPKVAALVEFLGSRVDHSIGRISLDLPGAVHDDELAAEAEVLTAALWASVAAVVDALPPEHRGFAAYATHPKRNLDDGTPIQVLGLDFATRKCFAVIRDDAGGSTARPVRCLVCTVSQADA